MLTAAVQGVTWNGNWAFACDFTGQYKVLEAHFFGKNFPIFCIRAIFGGLKQPSFVKPEILLLAKARMLTGSKTWLLLYEMRL